MQRDPMEAVVNRYASHFDERHEPRAPDLWLTTDTGVRDYIARPRIDSMRSGFIVRIRRPLTSRRNDGRRIGITALTAVGGCPLSTRVSCGGSRPTAFPAGRASAGTHHSPHGTPLLDPSETHDR